MSSPDAAPAPPSTSRAGRNLPVAIAVGLALGAMIVLSLIFNKYLFAVVVTVAMLIAVWEPVSYTHLDVYKRQPYGSTGNYRAISRSEMTVAGCRRGPRRLQGAGYAR